MIAKLTPHLILFHIIRDFLIINQTFLYIAFDGKGID